MPDQDDKIIFRITGGFALVGVLFLGIGGYVASRNIAYSRDGIAAVGTVVGTYTSASTYRGDGSSTTILATFTTSDGRSELARQQTAGWGLKAGRKVVVRYMPGHPEKAQIEVWARWQLSLFMLVMAAGFALPFGIDRYFTCSNWLYQRRMARLKTTKSKRPRVTNRAQPNRRRNRA